MLTMGAAAFGAFVSFPVAVAGGIGLGLVYQVVAAETNNAGTAELAVFGVILLAILVRGRAIGRAFATEGAAVPERPGLRVPEVLKSSMLLRHGMKWLVGISLVVAVVFPLLPYFKSNQFLLVLVLVYALVGVSLTMLIGWSGQVSLGHFALVGIAAYLTARWAGRSGWSVVELLVVTGVVGAAVMVAIGLPALRVRGLTLAVTTLGLAVIAPDWLYLQSWVGGATPFTTPVQVTSVLPGAGPDRLAALPLLRGVGRARRGRSRRGDSPPLRDRADCHRGEGQRASQRGVRDQAGHGQAARPGPVGIRRGQRRGLLGPRLAERVTHAIHRRHLDRGLGYSGDRRSGVAGRCRRSCGAVVHGYLFYRAPSQRSTWVPSVRTWGSCCSSAVLVWSAR